MDKPKERDYMFDTFRGLLMLSIPVSHFTKMAGNQYAALYTGGGFDTPTLAGFIYVTINVFVMQAFMFLSGYFSKKPERARETAFTTFMWPSVVFTTVYFVIRYLFFGNAHLDYLTPPFALWFLFALFFYRYFLGSMTKFQWLLPFSLIMVLVAGQVKEFGDWMSLGRMISYYPFFLIGFYCSKERLAWLRRLKHHPVWLTLLGVSLVGISILLINVGPRPGWYLLREYVGSFKGMPWYADTFYRIVLMILPSAWIIFMVNVLPSKKGFLAFVGTNTMPIYMFHLTLRYVIQFFGMYVCGFACLTVAWFSAVSLVFRKWKNNVAYGIVIVLSIVGWYFFYASGVLDPLVGLCPQNKAVFYLLTYGSALLCGVSFVAPFWIKLYDIMVDGPLHAPFLTRFLTGPHKPEVEVETKDEAAQPVQA